MATGSLTNNLEIPTPGVAMSKKEPNYSLLGKYETSYPKEVNPYNINPLMGYRTQPPAHGYTGFLVRSHELQRYAAKSAKVHTMMLMTMIMDMNDNPKRYAPRNKTEKIQMKAIHNAFNPIANAFIFPDDFVKIYDDKPKHPLYALLQSVDKQNKIISEKINKIIMECNAHLFISSN